MTVLAAAAALAIGSAASAQQREWRIAGRVVGADSQPIAQASVEATGLGVLAVSGVDGRYSLVLPPRVSPGSAVTIVTRRLGYRPKSATLARAGDTATLDFTLLPIADQLSGVVITALGIEREKSQLGTAMQVVQHDELNQTRQKTLLAQLEGKVPGLVIQTSGAQGGSSKVRMRGETGFFYQELLYVLDGVPLDHKDFSMASVVGGYDFGTTIGDLDPAEIEQITVLKGPNAAALYGSAAAAGAIVITTKRSRADNRSIGADASVTVSVEAPSILPKYQNLYGQGAEGLFSYVDGLGGGTNDGLDQSFGPRLNGQPIDQFTGKAQPWVAHPNNVRDFFDTGKTFAVNAAVSGGTDRANARLAAGSEQVAGLIPNNSLRTTTVALSGALAARSDLRVDAQLRYVQNEGWNRPGVGYNTGILEQFIWFGRQVDINALRRRIGADGNEFNWNHNYHNNPYWLQYDNPEYDARDHLFGTASITFTPRQWLTVLGRGGREVQSSSFSQRWARGHIQQTDLAYNGAYSYQDISSNVTHLDLITTARRDVGASLRVTATLGVTDRRSTATFASDASRTLIEPNVYESFNSAERPFSGRDTQHGITQSNFGSLTASWREWWTVEGTLRRDAVTGLPKGKNSFLYPSINTALVITDAVPGLRSRLLDFAKLRASTALVGNGHPVYVPPQFAGTARGFAGLPEYRYVTIIDNPDLRPEETRANEFGVEISLLGGRGSMDVTRYTRNTSNQTLFSSPSAASGIVGGNLPTGEIRNHGWEVQATAIPLRREGRFSWSSTVGFARNRAVVKSLAPGVDALMIGPTALDLNVVARPNKRWGLLEGFPLLRDSAGRLLTAGGFPLPGDRRSLGSAERAWTGSWSNVVAWKRLSLTALIDVRAGGHIYSTSNMLGNYTGVLRTSLRGREIEWNKPGVVVGGIDIESGKANRDTITAEQYWQTIGSIHEPFIYSAGYVKLRELRLDLTLPRAVAARLGVRTATVALTGRNLFTRARMPNFDPEFAYNNGNNTTEFAPMPTARSIGFNLRLSP